MQANYWNEWDKAYDRAQAKLRSRAVGSEFIGVVIAWICLEFFVVVKPLAIAVYRWAIPRLLLTIEQFKSATKEWRFNRNETMG